MTRFSDAYFHQTKVGESRWWSWLSGFWFVLVGWIIAQAVFTGPIPEVAREIDPEKYTAFQEAAQNMFAGDIALQLSLWMGLFVLFAIIAGIFYLIARVSSKITQRITAMIAGIGMGISAFALFRVIPLANDAAMNALFMEFIGLSPVNYLLMLAVFPGTAACMFLVQKFVHMRTIRSLHTAYQTFDWKRVLFSIAVLWTVFSAVTLILHVTGISPVKFVFDPTRFLGFAIVTLLFIPLQSATEEIIFRGYLNQGFGHFISNKWVVFIITSVLFAAMHLSNPEAVAGAEGGTFSHLLVMSQYFLFGFILSVIVYFEDGLESAIGIHAGNNMFAAMIMNYEGSVLPTPSIFLAQINPTIDAPIGIFTLCLVGYILYRTRKPRTLADLGPSGDISSDGSSKMSI